MQGLLLMEEHELSSKFSSLIKFRKQLEIEAKEKNITVYQMCINWVLQQQWIDKVVFGIASLGQAKELILSIGNANIDSYDFHKYKVDDPNIINPARWS